MRASKAILVVGSLAFIATHAYLFQSYRSRIQKNPSLTLDVAARHIESRLAEPLVASLTDVADKEVDFAAVISFQPLCEKKTQATRAVYDVTFENRLERVINGTTSPSLSLAPSVTKDLIETTFVPGETPSSCRSVERSLEKKKRTPRESVIQASGQISWINAPPEYNQCSEIGPRFPDAAVRKGDEWTQELAVNPAYNENGTTTARLRVVSTFEDDGQKIVRINRRYQYTMKTAIPTSMKPETTADPSKDTTLVRVDELLDLAVDSGITLRQETVQQLYCERFPIFGLGGALTTAKRQLVLKELLN